ncbi:unnamed protein product [Phytophthora fragariaefolia]|uniref:Unnamed protein product n=1 Tax=Phytophthora fragariaefolia TaxID=1490495 RepID=A0A9W6TN71_9STRA|nr:unnamed protein product [Phytophthora fragariaefolia]
MGADAIRRTKAQPNQFKQYLNNLHAQILMMFVYPIYEALFRTTEGSHFQLLVILLLPIIKVFLKDIVRKSTMHIGDMVPETVIFTVDFFNAIYVATCMQTSSSALSISAITITNILQTVAMLNGLHRRTGSISSKLHNLSQLSSENEKDLLLSVLCSLCRDPEKFKKQNRAGIMIRSCFPHHLSAADTIVLNTLDTAKKETSITRQQSAKPAAVAPYPNSPDSSIRESIFSQQTHCPCFRNRVSFVSPTADSVNVVYPPNQQVKRSTTHKPKLDDTSDHPVILRDSLEALFTIECLVVTTYLEAIIPLFYTTYVLVMIRLPSAKYHTEMVGITHDNVGARILPVFAFGLLEVASLVLLVVTIKRNCMMRAIYQLAFVLESQRSSIQTKLIVWMMITLCFRVMHFGT